MTIKNRSFFSSGPCIKPKEWTGQHLLQSKYLGRSHRAVDTVPYIQEIVQRIRDVLDIPPEYHVALTQTSATGAMEMLLWNLLDIHHNVDIWVWDVFSQRWAYDVMQSLRLPHARILHFPFENDCTDHHRIITWCGTSSGMAFPENWTPNLGKGLVFADCTSIVGAQHLPWHHLDAVAFSWQKAFAAEAGLGTIVLSPKAYEHLEHHRPTWPIPHILRMHKNSPAIEVQSDIFHGSLSNTPSWLGLIELDHALQWATAQEKINGLKKRIARNNHVMQNWVRISKWATFHVQNEQWRAPMACCIAIRHAHFEALNTLSQWTFLKQISANLAAHNIAYDILNHAHDAPCFRIWTGPTVEPNDLENLVFHLEKYVEDALLVTAQNVK